jgi:hypothetical protein
VSAEEATRLSKLLDTQRAELENALAQWESVAEEIEATA